MSDLTDKMARQAILAVVAGWLVSATPGLAGTDSKVNQDIGPLLQNETSITVNPGWAGNVVVGYNEAPGSAAGLGISYSFNGGNSWLDSQTPSVWGTDADPALASDLLGNVFAAMISYGTTPVGAIFPNNGIYVSRSTDGGVTWLLPVTTVDQYTVGPPGGCVLYRQGVHRLRHVRRSYVHQ